MEQVVEDWMRVQDLMARADTLVAQSRRVILEMHSQSERIARLFWQADRVAREVNGSWHLPASSQNERN